MLHMHFDKCPDERERFPIFTTGYEGSIPFLARGSTGPLGGERRLAEYFHGRYEIAAWYAVSGIDIQKLLEMAYPTYPHDTLSFRYPQAGTQDFFV